MKITYELLPTYSERRVMPGEQKEITACLTGPPSQLECNMEAWTVTMSWRQNRQEGTLLWMPKNNDIPCASAAFIPSKSLYSSGNGDSSRQSRPLAFGER